MLDDIRSTTNNDPEVTLLPKDEFIARYNGCLDRLIAIAKTAMSTGEARQLGTCVTEAFIALAAVRRSPKTHGPESLVTEFEELVSDFERAFPPRA